MKQKVYILIEEHPYEGFGAPMGVFSSYELANAYLEKEVKLKRDRSCFEIMEYTLDDDT